jgi:TetR/AcrR family transcriptional repressor of nem operon
VSDSVATTILPPGRGRPRQFDVDGVLDQVVELFWRQGFEATSVADIVEATGLNKSSLYNAFGSKEELFDRALTRYVEMRAGLLQEIVVDGTRGLDDIFALMTFMESEITSELGGRGCLAVNSSTELGNRDDETRAASSLYRDTIRRALTAALTRAEDLGELPDGSAPTYAEVLLPWMLGMAVVASGGAERAEIAAHFDAARTLLTSLRIDG